MNKGVFNLGALFGFFLDVRAMTVKYCKKRLQWEIKFYSCDGQSAKWVGVEMPRGGWGGAKGFAHVLLC